ncbi:hypothetical protein HZC53_03385 [Candidatus Uhrbacteria bacterium]|nr:hypothetical protein [Candidatus Uhrbacteria bacterium]
MQNCARLITLLGLMLVVGCGGNVENNYYTTEQAGGHSGIGGSAGSSGQAGNGGSVSTGGSAGSAGTGGTAGVAGSSGQAGSSGASGTGGTMSDGGTAGEAGSAGSGDDAGADAADAQTAPVLEVSLSASTPAGMNMCDGSQATVFKFDLANGSASDITLDKLRLHRIGVGSSSDISIGGLSGNFVSLGIPDSTGYVTFDDMAFTIPAKTVITLSYWIQAASSSTQIGDQIAIELADVGAVTLAGNAKVQGSFPVRGNVFTLSAAKCGTLSAELAPAQVSGTVVKKSQNVEVLGIKFTAGINDVLLTLLPLKCQASLNGAPFSGSDCMKRITSLALYDGDTQVSTAFVPNTDGTATFNPNWLIPNGVTKTLTVKASFASSASPDQPYDKIAIGLTDGGAAQDMVYGQYVGVTVGAILANQLSQNPSVTTTILNSGTLKIEADGHPAAQIVVGGKDSWSVAASYKATAQYEAATIDYSDVIQDSPYLADNADVVAVAVASGGTIHGQTVLPASDTGCADADLNGYPIEVPKDGSTNIQVWVKYAAPMPGAVVNNAQHGVPRSGHQPRVGLSDSIVGPEWNSAYLGKFNLRTTGAVSGERLYADAAGVAKPNAMILRKTKPILTAQNLANNVLFNGEVELYRFQLAADQAGCVGFKQIAFGITGQQYVGFSNFRFYRGSSQIPSSEYHVVDIKNGTDLYSGATENLSSTYALVNVSFTAEDTVCGSGNVYSLRGTANSVSSGKSVSINLLHEYPVVITGVPVGSLINMAPENPNPWFFHVLQGQNTSGPFIWSDQSELPHSESSADWTNGYLVEDQTHTVVLTN